MTTILAVCVIFILAIVALFQLYLIRNLSFRIEMYTEEVSDLSLTLERTRRISADRFRQSLETQLLLDRSYKNIEMLLKENEKLTI